jgi:phosphoenolpyruvate carboxykinase (ATP)
MECFCQNACSCRRRQARQWGGRSRSPATARKLVGMFQNNFTKYEKHVDVEVRDAAPEFRLAAE